MNLIVLTPGKEIFKGSILSVKVPGTTGQFEVRKGHAAIVSSLRSGEVKIKPESGETVTFSIENGFLEVLRDEVSLLIQGYQV